MYVKNSRKKFFIKETCAILALTIEFGFKSRNLLGFSLSSRGRETLFRLRRSRLMHNLDLNVAPSINGEKTAGRRS
jgi:hypothetical protein